MRLLKYFRCSWSQRKSQEMVAESVQSTCSNAPCFLYFFCCPPHSRHCDGYHSWTLVLWEQRGRIGHHNIVDDIFAVYCRSCVKLGQACEVLQFEATRWQHKSNKKIFTKISPARGSKVLTMVGKTAKLDLAFSPFSANQVKFLKLFVIIIEVL